MKKFSIGILLGCFLAWTLWPQTPPAPYQFSVNATTTVANCTPVANQTAYCFVGSFGSGPPTIYVSQNGAAFVPTTIVISVNGQTGAVVLTVPSKAVIPSQTVPLQ